MAHTKSAGAANNTRDSKPKYLGVKRFAGEVVKNGDILVRQRGSAIIPGANVRQGKDFTLYSVAKGKVAFSDKRKTRFDGNTRRVKMVSVLAS